VDTDVPSAAGLRAHAQLSLIMDEIVNSVYGISSTGLIYPQTLSRADTALRKLSSWHAELPPCLRIQETSECSDRASLVLQMIYNQVRFHSALPFPFHRLKSYSL
jgi:RES domain-containing protein